MVKFTVSVSRKRPYFSNWELLFPGLLFVSNTQPVNSQHDDALPSKYQVSLPAKENAVG